MSSNTETRRPSWVIPVIGFLIGLMIGWWVIGWLLWPVNWTNALPADLTATERDQYLMMVAESYAASRNANLAKQRVSSWAPQDLPQHLANLQARVAANPQQAAQVQALSDLVGASRAPSAGGLVPTPTPAQGARPPSASTSGAGPDVPAILRGIATVLLWLLLLAGAVWLAYYLWRRLRSAHNKELKPAIDASIRQPRATAPVQRSLDEATEQPKTTWPDPYASSSPEAEAVERTEAPAVEPQPAPPPARSPYAPPAAATRPAAPASAAVPKAAVAVASASAGLTRVSEHRGLYQMGEPDYDEAFDITDAAGNYLGQCGLELNDPVGRGHDQAAALQAWLWDTNDPDTRVKVLMSEGAYRDTAMRDQLKGDHEAMAVRPGVEFELESHKLLLRGQVEKVEYAEQDPPSTIFAEFLVRLQVYKRIDAGSR